MASEEKPDKADGDRLGRTLVASDGRILMFGCDRFISDVVQGGCCFVCGARPGSKTFNDEHIIPRWALKRFRLFDKTITLPNGERRKYDRYKVPCCKECNSLLGRTVETPVSELLTGSFTAVADRLSEQGSDLLFVWLSLLFFKIHLKDRSVTLQKNPNLGSEVVGDMYDWPSFHHVHEVARATYTGARLRRGIVGSIRVFPIKDGFLRDEFDYQSFSFEQVIAVRIGHVGIVAALDDAGAAASAWSHELATVTKPISIIQLKELCAMFAVASEDLIDRPRFGTVTDGTIVEMFAQVPPFRFRDFDRKRFGHALAYALRDIIAAGRIILGGTADPAEVTAILEAGEARFLIDADGKQVNMVAMDNPEAE